MKSAGLLSAANADVNVHIDAYKPGNVRSHGFAQIEQAREGSGFVKLPWQLTLALSKLLGCARLPRRMPREPR